MNSVATISSTLNPLDFAALITKARQAAAPTGAIPAAELQKLAPASHTSATAASDAPDKPFANVLRDMVNDVNAKQSAAGEAVGGLLSGQNVSLHQTMIAVEEASVSFQLMVEMRNKMLEAYQEIMRMQV
jgi:flagellar hook-basal body complex protein FliE